MTANINPSSFIPNESTVPETTARIKKSSGSNGFLVVAVILFVMAVLSGVGAFLYERSAQSELADTQDQLETARANFDPASVQDYIELDARLSAARELLQDHVVLTPLFDLIEDNTLRSVRFTGFSFNFEDQSSNNSGNQAEPVPTIGLQGEANSYAAVALQSDVFVAHPSIQNAELSGFTFNDEGRVTFSASFSVDPQLLSYGVPSADNGADTDATGSASDGADTGDAAPE